MSASTPPPPPPPPSGPPPSGPPPSGPPPGGYGQPAYGGAPDPAAWSVGDAVSWGWRKFQAHLGQVMLAILVVFVVNAVLRGVGYTMRDELVLSLLFNLVSWVVTTVLSAGIVRAALDIADNRSPQALQVLTPPRLPQVLLLGVVTGVLVSVGLVLCIIPGLVVMFFTAFAVYFLMDRPDLDAIGALRASFELVKGNAGSVLLWFLTCIGLLIVGTLACLVGLLVALPVVYLGTAYTYKRLTGQAVMQ